MSEIPTQQEPIRINPEDINNPADYANSLPDAYNGNPHTEWVEQLRLGDARERARAEQAMGPALDNVFEKFADNIVFDDESGVEQLLLEMPFRDRKAKITLTRSPLDEEGIRTATMAFEAKKAWSNALVYTDGPGKLPRLQDGVIEKQSGKVIVRENEYMNQDPQIARNGKLWLGNIHNELAPAQVNTLSRVGRTALKRLFGRS